VFKQKYIFLDSILDWIRKSIKNHTNCSITWKDTLKSFGVVGYGLPWCIGDGTKFCIREDPWKGSEGHHLLSPELIQFLEEQGLFHLNQVVDPAQNSIWIQA